MCIKTLDDEQIRTIILKNVPTTFRDKKVAKNFSGGKMILRTFAAVILRKIKQNYFI